MSDFIHARDYLDEGDIVIVDCSHQCNVLIMTDSNFSSYQRGGGYEYLGGHYKRLPARIAVPHSGEWNTVINLGGGSAQIRYNIRYIKRRAA